MTNFEKLKQLDSENFWNEIQRLNKLQTSNYIDFIAYLNSEDDDTSHFVRSIGRCRIAPSEMEIINRCNEATLQGRPLTESEKEIYIATHSRPAVMLKKIERFGKTYVLVMTDEGAIMSVPESSITEYKA